MNAQDLKPVYADNNPNWRIVYMPGGTWTLQEFKPIAPTTDKRGFGNRPDFTDWQDHNANMGFDDAKQLLATRNIFKPKK